MAKSWLLAAAAASAVFAVVAAGDCTLDSDASTVRVTNGYVSVTFNKDHPSLTEVGADWTGGGSYVNVLSPHMPGGLVLEREDGDGTTHSSAVQGSGAVLTVTVLANSSSLVSFRVEGAVNVLF